MAKDLPQVLLLKEKGTTIGPVFSETRPKNPATLLKRP
jgi:hypothetical protein